MKLSNKKPGSGIPLQFDMTEKHLKNCDRKFLRETLHCNLTSSMISSFQTVVLKSMINIKSYSTLVTVEHKNDK